MAVQIKGLDEYILVVLFVLVLKRVFFCVCVNIERNIAMDFFNLAVIMIRPSTTSLGDLKYSNAFRET